MGIFASVGLGGSARGARRAGTRDFLMGCFVPAMVDSLTVRSPDPCRHGPSGFLSHWRRPSLGISNRAAVYTQPPRCNVNSSVRRRPGTPTPALWSPTLRLLFVTCPDDP